MKHTLLLLIIMFFAFNVRSQADFAFKNTTVLMQNTNSGKYLFGQSTQDGTNAFQFGKTSGFNSEDWELQEVDINNGVRYAIFHKLSQRYLTVTSAGGTPFLASKYSDLASEAIYQTFEFDFQTVAGRFKIHTAFNTNSNNPALGLDYVLAIQNASTSDNAQLITETNQTTGNSDDQKFDLTDLDPAVNPSSATPSLEDQFQGRTIGMISKQDNLELKGDGTSDLINSSTNFTNFNQEFKLEYTDETGWYRIKHKPSGLYVTVIVPIDGGDVQLRTDAGSDPHQRFKFIFQSANTYEIHSKYSVGPSNLSVGLVLQMVQGNDNAPMQLGANLSTNNPWQQFVLSKYLPEAAQFSSGTEINSDGKILEKQYYISNFESLAMLEPYVVGNDTFVRVQPHPVYGEQSEWTVDEARKQDFTGTVFYRIRYGKTGQCLYMPVGDENTTPGANVSMLLKTNTDVNFDGRWEFNITSQVTAAHTFTIRSRAGTGITRLQVNDDGILATEDNSNSLYDQNKQFFMNLSWPMDDSKIYSIISKSQGHLVCDSGVRQDGIPLYHIGYADPTCMWNFKSTGDGFYHIQNTLTGGYVTTRGNTNYLSQLFTSMSATTDAEKWQLIVSGNFYRLKNKQSGFYFGLANHPEEGANIYQGIQSDAGTLWIVTRADYVSEPAPPAVVSANLLDNFSPLSQNALNDAGYRQKMIQNLGFIIDPITYTGPIPISTGYNPSNLPNVYNVIRSALAYKYNYNSQVDNAISNYKLDTAGHRAQVIFALKSYILDNLSRRARSSWTSDEQALVDWLQDRIKQIRVSYGTRLETSWNNFTLTNNNYATDLPFSFLIDGLTVGYQDFVNPPYFQPDESQQISVDEYYFLSSVKQYKNPGFLSTLSTSIYSIAGGMAITSLASIKFASLPSTPLSDAIQGWKVKQQLAEMDAVETDATDGATTFTEESLGEIIGAVCDGAGAAAIAIVALEALVMKAIDVAKFENFVSHLNNNVNRLKNENINIPVIQQGNSILQQLNLNRDLDLIFSSGIRFDNAITITYEFTGNGSWQDANNWKDGSIPPAIIQYGTEVDINPSANGECLVDTNILLLGGKIIVKPGKKIRIATPSGNQLGGTLTVPSISNQ